jgi:hypothetical protein
MLEIKLIAEKGRGAVATQSIQKGILIEKAPVASFPPDQREVIQDTEIGPYYFVRPTEYDSEDSKVKGYIVFGLSSFCNHSEQPNAKIEWCKDRIGLWAKLTALQDIQAGEEVTIFYTNIDEYPTEEFVD